MKATYSYIGILFMILIPSKGLAQYSKSEWKERNTWMDVPMIFELANVAPGSIVADVGCHEGYLSFHLAERVGDNGQVYSVDVREDRLETLRKNLKNSEFKNIKVILGDYDNPKLPPETLDAVFVMDTYHEIEDYMDVLQHIKESLKPGGRILVLEKLKKHARGKPRDEQTAAHTLSLKFVKRELEETGFSITKEIDDFGQWENDPEKIMWILVANKNSD